MGDFSTRKQPTKVNQLRKKKVYNVQCGGGFVVALGKDVPEGYVKPKKSKRKDGGQGPKEEFKKVLDLEEGGIPPHNGSLRSKSQGSYERYR